MKRIVVTGIGGVTPLGSTIPTSWSRILNSESGITSIPESLFRSDDLNCKIAALIPLEGEHAFKVDDFISPKEQRRVGKFINYAIAASQEAVTDAGFDIDSMTEEERNRAGVLIGSGIGGLTTIEENAKILFESGPRRISPFFIPASLINLASGHISIKYGFKGPNTAVVTACTTGTHAIGDAARIINDGDADVMICGGTESAVCRLGVAGFAAARALSTKFNETPEKASRPWDKDRDGFVMGEGAGVLILEEYEHAKKRNAKIYAEVIGYGMSGDAHHITAPEPNGQGAFNAMTMALKKADISADQIDYINAHGTSTPLGDLIEVNAVKRLFSDHAKKLAISSTKSSIGHLLGAAGSVEAIFSIMALKDGALPPTINLDNPSEGCDLNFVPNIAEQRKINIAMSNSFGFGGTNGTVIFRKI